MKKFCQAVEEEMKERREKKEEREKKEDEMFSKKREAKMRSKVK